MKKKPLTSHPGLFRSPVTRGLAKDEKSPVDRQGGRFKAGLIRGFAVITRGEALGHYAWIDRTMLEQVRDALNASGSKGIKARFTHPSLSADGLGSFLGRAIGPARIVEDRVVADLHFSQSSHNTPDGDLASYVMDLAEQDPEHFGTSIVFEHDRDSERAFEDEHTKETTEGPGRRKRPAYEFVSPDEENVNNFYHVRLKALRAVDAVDEPAANPKGLFSRGQEVAREADALLAYAVGISEEAPAVAAFDVHPDRLASFVSRFLDSHNLEIRSKEEPMAEGTKADGQQAEKAGDQSAAATGNAKPGEQLAAATPPAANPPEATPATAATAPSADAAVLAERKRVSAITAVCDLAKVEPAKRQKWIDEGLSAEDVNLQLRQAMAANNPPPQAGGDPGQGDPNAKYREEYRKRDPKVAAASDVTEDEYIASRRVDDGLEPLVPGKPPKKA